ncbi:MAG: hypothetical protein EP335_00265 [Alphaproteobacteria bacterium]|nr:MAG: hypothetical protein EP335_00265 [Alphaproteobacteria bacterium]
MFTSQHQTAATRDIYELRYTAYLGNDSIRPNHQRMFMDGYDRAENCQSFIEYVEGVPAGSIRASVYDPEQPELPIPSMEVFGDVVERYSDCGEVLVESSKFVVHPSFQNRQNRLKLKLFGHIFDMAKEVGADYILTETRPEHARFYRTMHFEPVSEVRQARTLNFQIQLLACPIMSLRKAALADAALSNTFARFGLNL